MPTDVENLYSDLVKCASRYGIAVSEVKLDDEIPGEFDGPTIKLNQDYDATERAFYLAHSVGSIAQWCLHRERTQQTFAALRAAFVMKGEAPDHGDMRG